MIRNEQVNHIFELAEVLWIKSISNLIFKGAISPPGNKNIISN